MSDKADSLLKEAMEILQWEENGTPSVDVAVRISQYLESKKNQQVSGDNMNVFDPDIIICREYRLNDQQFYHWDKKPVYGSTEVTAGAAIRSLAYRAMRIEEVEAELRELKHAALEVLTARDNDDAPYGHPSHCHGERGKWDRDGSECEHCAAYDKLASLVGQPS